jgi:NADH-quinone oxidoreductase subunit N
MLRMKISLYHIEKKMFLMFWAIAGHLLIIQQNWLTFYLGIEMMTIPFYALGALSRHPLAIEGVLKYFITNAVFSIAWIVSFSLIASGAESFSYHEIIVLDFEGIFFALMTAMLLALKLGVFPCGYWVPDFYQVISRSSIIWIGFIPKFLTLVVIHHFMKIYEFSQSAHVLALIVVGCGTIWGHLGAVFQNNIQRFLGYTAAAQVGFMLSPFFVRGSNGISISLIYLVTYTISSLMFLYGLQRSFLEGAQIIKRVKGQYGVLVYSYFLGLISLSGFPPFPGFFAKLYVLQVVLSDANFLPLAIFLVLSSVVGLYYYLEWMLKTKGRFTEKY